MLMIIKIVIGIIGVWLGDVMLPDVKFPSFTPILLTGIALALIGYAMEWIMLRRGTLWLTTVADWAVAAAVLYLCRYIFASTYISLTGALLTGGLLALAEYFMHRYSINQSLRNAGT